MNLTQLNEKLLIRNGLLLRIGLFEIYLNFIAWPSIDQVVRTGSGVNIVGANFWMQSLCVHNSRIIPTTYVDSETFVCNSQT